jgi:hypothetical protein
VLRGRGRGIIRFEPIVDTQPLEPPKPANPWMGVSAVPEGLGFRV